MVNFCRWPTGRTSAREQIWFWPSPVQTFWDKETTGPKQSSATPPPVFSSAEDKRRNHRNLLGTAIKPCSWKMLLVKVQLESVVGLVGRWTTEVNTAVPWERRYVCGSRRLCNQELLQVSWSSRLSGHLCWFLRPTDIPWHLPIVHSISLPNKRIPQWFSV